MISFLMAPKKKKQIFYAIDSPYTRFKTSYRYFAQWSNTSNLRKNIEYLYDISKKIMIY